MALLPYYNTGTATVANGATVVTGVGTVWTLLRAGDQFGLNTGSPMIRIASIESDTSLTLAFAWSGTGLVAAAYEIRRIPDAIRALEYQTLVVDLLNSVIANGRGLFYRFSASIAPADPGLGYLRLNGLPAVATELYIDDVDGNSANDGLLLDSIDNGPATPKAAIIIRSTTSPSTWAIFDFSGTVVNMTGYRKLTSLAYVQGSGVFTEGDTISFSWVERGVQGIANGYPLDFSTVVTDTDPGVGMFQGNSAVFASITSLFIDDFAVGGLRSIDLFVESFDDNLNAVSKGTIRFQSAIDATVFMEFSVTGVVTSVAGYNKVAVTPIAGAIPPNGTRMAMVFSRAGRDGAPAGVPMLYSSVTTPGITTTGHIRFNNAAYVSATALYVPDVAALTTGLFTPLANLSDFQALITFARNIGADGIYGFKTTGPAVLAAGYWTVPIVWVNGSAALNDGDALYMTVTRQGARAQNSGAQYYFDSEATGVGAPDNFGVKINSTSFANATQIIIDAEQIGNISLANYIATWDDSTSFRSRGTIVLSLPGALEPVGFSIIGAMTVAAGYYVIPVKWAYGPNGLASGFVVEGSQIYVEFIASGNDGIARSWPYIIDAAITGFVLGETAKVRFNNLTAASITKVFVTDVTEFGNNTAAIIDTFDDQTNATAGPGILRFTSYDDHAQYLELRVVSVVDQVNYKEINVTYIFGEDFPGGTRVLMSYVASGNDGVGTPGTNGTNGVLTGTEEAITVSRTLVVGDKGKNLVGAPMAADFTLTAPVAATLAATFMALIANAPTSTFNVVINPAAGQLIEGATTFILYPGESGILAVNSALDGLRMLLTSYRASLAADNAVARYDGPIGRIQSSNVTIDDNGNVHTVGEIQSGGFYPLAGGTANSLTLSPTIPITGYATGQRFTFRALLTNTATVVELNVSATVLKNIRKIVNGVEQALATGDIIIHQRYEVVYDELANGAVGAFILIFPSGTIQAENIIAKAAFLPFANNTVALGSSTLQFSGVWLAEGAVINWDNGDATLAQVGNVVTLAGASLSIADGQLVFPATANPSANANTLDDYEEGVWTPTLTTDGVNFTSVTYDALTAGKYTKIGNVVYVSGRLRTDAVTVGSASGNVVIGGLPFAPSATAPNGSFSIGNVSSWNVQNPMQINVDTTNTRIYLWYRTVVTGGGSNVAVAGVNVGADQNNLEFAGHYFI